MNVFDHEKWAFHSKVEPQVNVSFPKQSVKRYWAIYIYIYIYIYKISLPVILFSGILDE